MCLPEQSYLVQELHSHSLWGVPTWSHVCSGNPNQQVGVYTHAYHAPSDQESQLSHRKMSTLGGNWYNPLVAQRVKNLPAVFDPRAGKTP